MKIEERTITDTISQIVMSDRRVVPIQQHRIRRAAFQLNRHNNNNNMTMPPPRRRNNRTYNCTNVIGWNPFGQQEVRKPKPHIEGGIEVTADTIETVIKSAQLVIIYFYAAWDKFCKMSMPLFDEAVDAVRKQYPDKKQVVMGKFNCDKYGYVEYDYYVTSYPTIKIFRNGQQVKGKYKGSLYADDLKKYIIMELQNPIKQFNDQKELVNANEGKKIIVGYFDNVEMSEYENYRRVAQNLKQFAQFYVRFGNENENMSTCNKPIIVFTPESSSLCDEEETFGASAKDYDELNLWAHKKCMVQEMTFDNFQDLIEDRYPLLILYYNPNDCGSVKDFKEIVATSMINRTHDVNFVISNGLEFSDCIEKYGKDETDLPLVAIESRNNIFLFPEALDVNAPEKLKEFMNDFDIGKLQYIERTGGEWTKQVAYLEHPKNNRGFR